MKLRQFYVYIVTNKYRKVLYIGVTNDLSRRLAEHAQGITKGFTNQYNLNYLMYFEGMTPIGQLPARSSSRAGTASGSSILSKKLTLIWKIFPGCCVNRHPELVPGSRCSFTDATSQLF